MDRLWRTAGRDWWPDEAITDEHVHAAIAGAPVDVMITHESPARTPVRPVGRVLATNPFGFPQDALVESAASRERVTRVWDSLHPSLLLHGHMHVRGSGSTEDGRRVISLGADGQEGHLVFLDSETLAVDTPSLRQVRQAVNRP